MIKISIDHKSPREDWPEQFIQQLEQSGHKLSEAEKFIVRTAMNSKSTAYGKLTTKRVR